MTSVLFFVVLLGLIITARSKQTAWRTRIDALGLRSLVVLLLVDPFMLAMLAALWHSGRMLGGAHGVVSEAPRWVRGTWSAVPLFLAGLVGPLAVRWIVERGFGARARRFLFG